MIKQLIALLFVSSTLFTLSPIVEETIEQIFQKPIDQLIINPLSGGYSKASLYKIQDIGQTYVLRFTNEPDREHAQREIYAMVEASKAGFGPHIYSIYHGTEAILMDFIPLHTTSIEDAKKPENCLKIAKALQKLHQTAPNPFARPSTPVRSAAIYQSLCEEGDADSCCLEALELVKQYSEILSSFPAPKVNTHGDLTPRNLFFTEESAVLIDWGETNYEDPMYDLTCFSLLHAYTPQEEAFLIKSYLEHEPTLDELKRYELVKKITYATLVLSVHDLIPILIKPEDLPLDPNSPIQDWAYYADAFSKNDKELSAQFFHDWARVALKLAH